MRPVLRTESAGQRGWVSLKINCCCLSQPSWPFAPHTCLLHIQKPVFPTSFLRTQEYATIPVLKHVTFFKYSFLIDLKKNKDEKAEYTIFRALMLFGMTLYWWVKDCKPRWECLNPKCIQYRE
jgi:hypothetical protein